MGLKNEIGEQNCFLNVLIQTVYHIKELRKFFLDAELDNTERNNVLNELQVYQLINVVYYKEILQYTKSKIKSIRSSYYN